ncbi:MAG: helix-turn-helix domain-containing protein, partial [Myxococcota bacterium]
FELELPPLRQREGDLALLTQTLLERIAAAADQPIKRISPAAAQVMARYPWPGNVRELQNVLQRESVVCDSAEIAPDDLPARVCRVAMPRDDFADGTRPGITTEARADDRDSPTEALPALLPNEDPTVPDLASGSMTLDEIERWAIERTLDSAGGNVSEAIRRLGIGRTTLYRKLKQYGLR